MFLHRRHVVVIVAQRQKPAMHHRVQRLDPAIHHLGETGDLGHIFHLKPRLAQRLGRTPGAQQFDAAPGKRLAKLD